MKANSITQSLFNFLGHYAPAFLILFYALSRFLILFYPTAAYSDVTFYYEKYANIWRYSLVPYREHLFEYGPVAIPLLYIPLEMDQRGYGKYYFNYRFETLIIETVLFLAMLATLHKIYKDGRKYILPLSTYIVLTTVAIDWLYEGVDLSFTTAIMLSFMSVLWVNSKSILGKTVTWFFFWLSTGIKFLTLPMLVPLWLVTRSDFKKDFVALVIGFLMVWGLPLALYRSSLSVSFVYNFSRPIKYSSFPAHLIRWANSFTNTEVRREEAPDFPYEGPVSNNMTQIVKILYPLSLLLVLAWATFETFRVEGRALALSKPMAALKTFFSASNLSSESQFSLLLKIYGVYCFTGFLTAKIFSQPFHLWHLPLLALFPFITRKQWWWYVFLVTVMVLLEMTGWLQIKPGPMLIPPITQQLARDLFRFLPMFVILAFWIGAEIKTKNSKLK